MGHREVTEAPSSMVTRVDSWKVRGRSFRLSSADREGINDRACTLRPRRAITTRCEKRSLSRDTTSRAEMIIREPVIESEIIARAS